LEVQSGAWKAEIISFRTNGIRYKKQYISAPKLLSMNWRTCGEPTFSQPEILGIHRGTWRT
jgi:hypothetical protein